MILKCLRQNLMSDAHIQIKTTRGEGPHVEMYSKHSLSPSHSVQIPLLHFFQKQLLQGLPQGAVLGCLSFNITIDDLKVAIQKSLGILCLLFTDDIVMWATCNHIKVIVETLDTVLFHLEK
ncbi:hypothetical protein NPIL_210121 [Nephila pilipes]|uniref:Reverse transcriptase domain-containing protein n=1 Tax=Nephila pilipes TaxID=299642 RepID=A0A8X6PHE2_NEPPI|nr:hypothetical protein NPIL_210121 [Nephila pilipes]